MKTTDKIGRTLTDGQVVVEIVEDTKDGIKDSRG